MGGDFAADCGRVNIVFPTPLKTFCEGLAKSLSIRTTNISHKISDASEYKKAIEQKPMAFKILNVSLLQKVFDIIRKLW